jgi:DNA polymerase III, delta subunit/DNA polymerase III, delta subunit, C terminal
MFKHLTTLLKSARLPHGMIWADAETIELAAFIKLLLCQARTPDKTQACNYCKGCLLTQSEAGHPDVQWLKPEGKLNLIKIDQVREVIDFLTKSAQQGGYKVVVFESAEGLNHAAQNALLKSLEEPGANSFLVLQTAYPHLLLPTIKSRCQLLTKAAGATTRPDIVHDFIDALSLDFNPIGVAAKFKDTTLEVLFNGWYEFLYETLRFQQGLAIGPIWHAWRINIEAAAAKPSEKLYQFVDELVHLKSLLHKKIALNQQALLERALIEWRQCD